MKGLKQSSLYLLIFPLFFLSVWQKPYQDYQFDCGVSGGKLFFATTSDPKSFNPIIAKETSTTAVTGYIFEGLTRTDPRTFEVVPNLAETWKIRDGGKVLIFKLREDVLWNDGEKFTAHDVVFTFKDVIYNPLIPTSARDIFLIDGKEIAVEALSDYEVKFTLPAPSAPFLRFLGQDILPAHKYRSLIERDEFNFSLGLDSRPEDIVGTGPFRLRTYLPNERIILERNPHYWKKDACGKQLPYADEVILAIFPNQDTNLLKFFDGELDSYSLRPMDLAILGPRQEKDNFTIYNTGLTFSSQFIVFNQTPGKNPHTNKHFVTPYKRKWFRNKLFRQAVSYAIDREKICQIVYNGLAAPSYAAESPANILYHNPNVKKYPYNPHKAKDMLKAEGFIDSDGDGILEDSEGNKVEISFFTPAGDSIRIDIATLIKNDLEAIGITINFVALDFNNLVTKLSATYEWEMILIGLTGGIEPCGGKNVWAANGQLHMWNRSGGALDPYEERIDTIFNDAVKTLNEKKRKELFYEWQDIVAEELPLIYTVTPYSLFAVRDRFGNLYPTVLGAFSEIEHIYLKDKD